MLILNLFIQGIINGSTYALIAVGLTLIYGLLRILHVAHAGLFALGAYLSIWFTKELGSLPLGIFCSILIVGMIGMLIYRFVYSPLQGKPPFVALIASIGLFIFMQELLRVVFGPYGLSFENQPLTTTFEIAGLAFRASELLTLCSTALLFLALGAFVSYTRMGVGMRATVSDPEVAWSFGIDPMRIRYLCFFIASSMAAYAGSLVAILNNLVEPTMGSVPSYKMLAIIVLGGLGSVSGTVIASLILGVAEAIGTLYFGHYLDRDSIAFIVLIAALLFSPNGLKGKH